MASNTAPDAISEGDEGAMEHTTPQYDAGDSQYDPIRAEENAPLLDPASGELEVDEWETSTDPARLKFWRGVAKSNHTKSIKRVLLAIRQGEEREEIVMKRSVLVFDLESVEKRHHRYMDYAPPPSVLAPDADIKWMNDVAKEHLKTLLAIDRYLQSLPPPTSAFSDISRASSRRSRASNGSQAAALKAKLLETERLHKETELKRQQDLVESQRRAQEDQRIRELEHVRLAEENRIANERRQREYRAEMERQRLNLESIRTILDEIREEASSETSKNAFSPPFPVETSLPPERQRPGQPLVSVSAPIAPAAPAQSTASRYVGGLFGQASCARLAGDNERQPSRNPLPNVTMTTSGSRSTITTHSRPTAAYQTTSTFNRRAPASTPLMSTGIYARQREWPTSSTSIDGAATFRQPVTTSEQVYQRRSYAPPAVSNAGSTSFNPHATYAEPFSRRDESYFPPVTSIDGPAVGRPDSNPFISYGYESSMPNRYGYNRIPQDDGDPQHSMAGSTRFDTTPQPTPWPNNPSRPAGHPDASMPVPTYIPDEWIFDVDDDTRATVRSSTKPPKSSLPKFDGNPMNWPMFIQSFKVQVHDTCLNDAERQHHLRNCLTTEIQQHLGQALLNPGLYCYSLVELHRKFGNPRIVSTACSTSLLKLQPFRDNDYNSLRSFASTLHSVVATLRLGGYGHVT